MTKNVLPKPVTHRLAIFLLKDDLFSQEDAIDTTNTQRATVACGTSTGELYYRQAALHPPGWARFFEGDPVHATIKSLKAASNGAVMVVPAGGRCFALTWGTGRHMLVPGTFEDDFGLRVTLNSLTSDQVRSVDHVSFEEHTLQQRAQSSRAGTCTEFGVDVDQNLVKALTGVPSDKTLAVRMTGIDALAVSVPIARADLPDLLERYLAQYLSTNYKTHFPWADHLRPVGDRTRIDALDAQMVNKLRARDLTRLWLAIPDVLDHDDIESFSYTVGKKARHHYDTFLTDLLATVKDLAKIDVATLKHRYVYGQRSSLPKEPKTWSWYRCLYCEIDDGTNTYLLYDGKWYRVTRDFVEMIKQQVKARVKPSTLPPFDYGLSTKEEDYNKRVALVQPDLLLLDQDNVRHGGAYDQIEICDLFSVDKRFVHVKRWCSSATLSHLFNQGEVPARLLIQDDAFRKKVIGKLSGRHRTLIDPDGIKASEFTVVFAVASESAKPLDETLPIFSRMTFVRVASMLSTYGYNVELMKIDVVRGTHATAVPGALSPSTTAAATAP